MKRLGCSLSNENSEHAGRHRGSLIGRVFLNAVLPPRDMEQRFVPRWVAEPPRALRW